MSVDLWTKAKSNSSAPVRRVPSIVHDTLRSPGQPLEQATRAVMEPLFRHDLSRVRVHTDARAAESARAVDAVAYSIGPDVAFAEGQYRPAAPAGRRLLAHELSHVTQQQQAGAAAPGASLSLGDPDDRAEREAQRAADDFASGRSALPAGARLYDRPASTATLRRQPTQGATTCAPGETAVRVDVTGKSQLKCLQQGKGGSGAVVYEYKAGSRKKPTSINDKEKGAKEASFTNLDVPVLVYPPAVVSSTKVELFVFFHGHRADLGERAATEPGADPQGSEPIGAWTHLQEAVAGTGRIGIAPQAPRTWTWGTVKVEDPVTKKKVDKPQWIPHWDWEQALKGTGFDGLINAALGGLTRDLGLAATPLVPGSIHVAGHSGGGQGIGAATERTGGASVFGDNVQDVTLQDAGYGFFAAWTNLMDWFLHGTPEKTIRVLRPENGPTKVLLGADDVVKGKKVHMPGFNVKDLNDVIKSNKEDKILEAADDGPVPEPKSQPPRPGGFVLASKLLVKNIQTGKVQGRMVVFVAPGGGHYETVAASMGAAAAAGPQTTTDFLGEAKPGQYRVITGRAEVFTDADLGTRAKQAGSKTRNLDLKRDQIVEVTELKLGTPPKGSLAYAAHVNTDDGEGWTPLANLTPPTPPLKVQPLRRGSWQGPDQAFEARVRLAAAGGLSGSGIPLPYLDRIQRAFGARHDLSGVRAHLDERSAAAGRFINVAAYTAAGAMAFAGRPDLRTAAHEAAHVIQQRRGVSLAGGAGREHDPYERQADAVADAVVAGRPAAPLLDTTFHPAVQPAGAIPSSGLDVRDHS